MVWSFSFRAFAGDSPGRVLAVLFCGGGTGCFFLVLEQLPELAGSGREKLNSKVVWPTAHLCGGRIGWEIASAPISGGTPCGVGQTAHAVGEHGVVEAYPRCFRDCREVGLISERPWNQAASWAAQSRRAHCWGLRRATRCFGWLAAFRWQGRRNNQLPRDRSVERSGRLVSASGGMPVASRRWADGVGLAGLAPWSFD